MFFKKKIQNITEDTLSTIEGKNRVLELIRKCEKKIYNKERKITYKNSYSSNPITIIRENTEYREKINQYEEEIKVLQEQEQNIYYKEFGDKVNYYLLNNILKKYRLIKG